MKIILHLPMCHSSTNTYSSGQGIRAVSASILFRLPRATKQQFLSWPCFYFYPIQGKFDHVHIYTVAPLFPSSSSLHTAESISHFCFSMVICFSLRIRLYFTSCKVARMPLRRYQTITHVYSNPQTTFIMALVRRSNRLCFTQRRHGMYQ